MGAWIEILQCNNSAKYLLLSHPLLVRGLKL